MQLRFTITKDSFVVGIEKAEDGDDPALRTASIIMLIVANGITMPIEVDVGDAASIQPELRGDHASCPTIHDFVRNVFVHFGASITKIVIDHLADNGDLSAKVYFEGDNREMSLDLRVPDAIALAVRFGAPMFIEEDVFIRASSSDEAAAIVAQVEDLLPEVIQRGLQASIQ